MSSREEIDKYIFNSLELKVLELKKQHAPAYNKPISKLVCGVSSHLGGSLDSAGFATFPEAVLLLSKHSFQGAHTSSTRSGSPLCLDAPVV